MRGYLGRIQEAREFASTRAQWAKEDGLLNTFLWGELYRRFVPDEVRTAKPFAGNETRKGEVKREFRRRVRI